MASDLTVIVVGYNHADFITECLESILNQSLLPDTVLVFDDSSRDNTDEVVRAYRHDERERIRFQKNPHNIGLTRTLNRALEMTTSRFVTYISADDFMLPERIERQCQLMEETRADISYTDAIVVDRRSTRLYETSQIEFPWPEEPRRTSEVLACLFEANWIPAASIMLRTEKLKHIGGYDEGIFYEDFELLTRAASQQWLFVYASQPLVAVRRLETSLGATGFDGKSARFLVAQEHALRNFPRDGSRLAGDVASARWEIAKRASYTNLTKREKVAMLTAARAGAGSRTSYLFHATRTLLTR